MYCLGAAHLSRTLVSGVVAGVLSSISNMTFIKPLISLFGALTFSKVVML